MDATLECRSGNPPTAAPLHTRTASVTPASPEVISNLITSLSVISRPATAHFELPLDLLPESPVSPAEKHKVPRRLGSFGVDYGAFAKPSVSDLRQDPDELDDLAAAPPVVKTAKPPSGLSPFTAPKSPSYRDSAGGLRSFLGSRPSSRGSAASRDADVHSLGNISVERGPSAPSSPTELRNARSHDSWGKKSGRAPKGLMYMTSKERLQENEGRKRGSMGGNSSTIGLASSSNMARMSNPRTDPFLAQVAISEEPLSLDELIGAATARDSLSSSCAVPTRDSSLRKTGANANKRASTRTTRSSKRDSDHSAIPEDDYFSIGVATTTDSPEERVNRRSSYREGQMSRRSSKSGGKKERAAGEGFLDPSWATTAKANHYIDRYVTDTEAEMDDGAPSPNIAQGKRRDRDFGGDRSSRRRSGRSTPELRVNRSSSKLKRLSGPLSPRAEEKPRESTVSETTNVAYERPPSADSIDDSVEAYLRSPRLSQKIRHPQTGRVISFSEVGDPEGSAVFCCVGMGLTRYITAFYDELALTLKLRLITPDRPGVGDSEAYAEGTATPLGWPGKLHTA